MRSEHKIVVIACMFAWATFLFYKTPTDKTKFRRRKINRDYFNMYRGLLSKSARDELIPEEYRW